MNKTIIEIYGEEKTITDSQDRRYKKLTELFHEKFGQSEVIYFSAPGRTEILGNHTDHNNGKVIAASVNLDSIAAVAPNHSNKIKIFSDGYKNPFEIDLASLEKQDNESGTSAALIRGIAYKLSKAGFKIRGFNGYVSSSIPPGSGLSSSAAFESLIGTIFNSLFNDNKIPYDTIAKIGQYSENAYFGKPCGLMDQIACLHGGLVKIDFINLGKPLVNQIDFDFLHFDYSIVIVDTGGNHADLTEDYSSIPAEMKSIAEFFGEKVLRHVDEEIFIEKISEIRKTVGEYRPVLRALHYFEENKRVADAADCFSKNDFSKFLDLINESGNSSFKLLQNIYTNQNVNEQGVSLALSVTDMYIKDIGAGACRVHGGGFAGTIQAFLPKDRVEKYVRIVENIFGRGSSSIINIRPLGTVEVNYEDILHARH